MPLYNLAKLKRSGCVFHDFLQINLCTVRFHNFVPLTNISPNVRTKKP